LVPMPADEFTVEVTRRDRREREADADRQARGEADPDDTPTKPVRRRLMRIWLVSDLHCDSSPWSPAAVPAHDVLVIAGDVSNSPENAILELFRIAQYTHCPLVFTPGNHDYFGARLDDAFDGLVTGGVHVLRPGKPVIIGGVRFVGSTLWTDWLLNDH